MAPSPGTIVDFAALVILARKIARVAFAIHRDGTTFNPQQVDPA